MLCLRVGLSVMVIAVAAPAWSQQVSSRQVPGGNLAEGGAAADALVDISQVDPETFHAIAVRLPKGQVPRIDGHLDDEVWTLAQSAGRFVQREPRPGAPVSERTEFKILYDERKLYFAVWCYDRDPAGIRASELKRDAMLRKGDQLKITIDTFHDHRNGFYFSTNPLGALKDANSTENGRTINYDWNAIWECKTSVDEQGWYVEIAIPFSQLRFTSSPAETTWGLNLCRIIARRNEDAYWAPFPREWGTSGLARMSNAGHLLGLGHVVPRRRFELVPYTAPLVSEDYSAGTPVSATAKYGVDLRLGITSSLTADLTYKTDFAQVEADQEVVNTSRFSLFFPEKRQFFTESAGIFDYGRAGGSGGGDDIEQKAGLLQLFYSRQIGLSQGSQVPILGGAKVTGRTGGYAIGLMNIEADQGTVRSAPGRTMTVPRANYTALRIKRNILANSSIGAVVANRQGGLGADFNRAVGVDVGLVLGRATTVSGLVGKTFSPGAKGSDLGGAFDASWKRDVVNLGLTYVDIGERFNAEMGFIPRIDIRNPRVRAAWTPRPKRWGVRQVTVATNVEYFESHAGRPISRNHGVEVNVERQDSATLKVTYDRDFDVLPSNWTVGRGTIPLGPYTWDTFRARYSSNQARRVYGTASVDRGGYYSGHKRTYYGALNFLPVDTLLVETNYTHNEIFLPGVPTYATNTVNSRVSYSFTPNLFVKTFIQYNDDKKLGNLNALLWYIYRPGSDLYVVYNHGWDTDVPGRPGPLHVRPRNRSLAVKLTFWLSR